MQKAVNPITNKKIDQQKIPIGFGGGVEGGGGSVGVELVSNCSRIAVNKAKMRPLQTLSTFEVGRCRESYSAPDGIRSYQKSTIFYSKLSKPMCSSRAKMPSALLGMLRKEHSNLIRTVQILP